MYFRKKGGKRMADNRKIEPIQVKFTKRNKDLIVGYAKAEGITVSSLIENLLRKAGIIK